ncbi:MAG: 2-succinyl-5-enolpyruvyl-6-hydroxy-3-cyclohexene-1-carboxylic-acid synthase [Flavobacteriaceae bacterium]|jgi:2-succinyl-5-enolpyruvyl-6-hydroxy-3-cyclohexene-1-carboxylate synthase|nr:2-succinyl-5-enolpyruvyl-6-hydroxy-3-cyclohexene-1-carboxylic-acid synthase [Flavobacteriaceae bacterium]
MIYPEIKLAQSIIQICKAKNIQHIVISPGSRNAPLTIGFVSDPFFTCYSIADERCAAFFGMGIAQQTNYPVALVCTSGSALLNYYPAVAEAFYSQIPLLVISADRPTTKIDIGDGQTIRQRDVYNNHILFNANLEDEASQANDLLINQAIHTAINQKGPVHINAPFEEPLYNTIDELTVEVSLTELPPISTTPVDYNHYATAWNNAARKLVLVGVNPPHEIQQEIVDYLAADPSIIVFTETTSNLSHPSFINHIDRIITGFTEEDFKALQPTILLTFGGMVVSKRVKQMLRKYKPEQHWHIDLLRHYDTFGALSDVIIDTPQGFLSQLMKQASTVNSNYAAWMHALMVKRIDKHKDYLQSIPFSDFKAMQVILPTLPENSMLQISNSSIIRYAQLLPIDANIDVFCNRGTSGIDGSTSTAMGAAVGANKQTLLITGDISFLYDSNALWNNYTPTNFKIIILNNSGGSIFRSLPGHQDTEVFNTYFETTHSHTAEHLAKMYEYTYYKATDEKSLEKELNNFWKNNTQPAILEVFTPTKINNVVLSEYFKKIQ